MNKNPKELPPSPSRKKSARDIRRSSWQITVVVLAWAVTPAFPRSSDPKVIPHPQEVQIGDRSLNLAGASVAFDPSSKVLLAKEMLIQESRQAGARAGLSESSEGLTTPRILLVDWSESGPLRETVSELLDEKDKQILSDPSTSEQGYIIRVDPEGGRVVLVGGSSQGVLYAAATLLQLWDPDGVSLSVPEIHIRDYPDFRYRAAADWLLQTEVNRWAYDWGDGRAGYQERIKRKLDFCLKYKINMVFFDGFGWSVDRIPGYSRMMRDFNQYARARGIKLIFGGYGANYHERIIRPEHNIGRVYLNRHSYPHGSVYSCLPGDIVSSPESEMYMTTLGTCRANDALMDLKVDELEEFVRSVEPGALYIHHEDQGDFDPTQEAWMRRDYRCRQRWPNDDLKAQNGGAGALAYGYSRLLEAVRNVNNPDTDYNASRDCTVILISPVYRLREESRQDWENVLDLWETVVSLLPRHRNLQIGFREIFQQADTGQRWVEAFQQRMSSSGLSSNAFVFFLGGSQGYLNNYPFTATAVLNGHFAGAETIYNFNGASHQEPLQLLNANFGWNASAPGSRDPQSYRETNRLWHALNANLEMGEEIFGEGGFLELACRKIYGDQAGRSMQRFFTDFEQQPRTDLGLLVPQFGERIYALTVLFSVLERDSVYWDPADRSPVTLTHRAQEQIRRGHASRRREEVSADLWHTRLARVWQLQGKVNRTTLRSVSEALSSPDLRPDAVEDVEYLKRCIEVGRGFAELLSNYHRLLASACGDGSCRPRVTALRQQLEDLEATLYRHFEFETVGPLGGDQSSWLEALRKLRNHLAKMDSSSSTAGR